jgi:hypothetical protein
LHIVLPPVSLEGAKLTVLSIYLSTSLALLSVLPGSTMLRILT